MIRPLQRPPRPARSAWLTALMIYSAAAMAGPVVQPSVAAPATQPVAERQLAAGLSAMQRRDFAKAEAAFKAAASADPQSPAPWIGLAEMARVSGQAQQIEPALVQARKRAPKSVAVLNAWASWHYANQRFDAAEAAWREALTVNPQDAAVLTQLGDFEFNVRQRPAQAAKLYDQSLAIDPQRGGTWYALGTAQLSLGKAQDALASMRRAVEHSPGNPMALAGLARALAANGQIGEALAQYEDASKLAPQFAPARLERAELLLARGQGAEAVEALRRLVSDQPRLLAANLGLALALQAQNKPREALQAYQAVLAIDGRHLQALNNAAWLASDRALGVSDLGLAWARLAVTLPGGQDPMVKGTLAWVEFQRGDRQAALQRQREVVAGNGAQVAESHYLLGRMLVDAGEPAAARPALERALQINPRFAYAEESRQLLARQR
jgi:tetratricopeptide (TPR) repeat protein